MTVTGLTLGENLERWTHKYGELPAGQDIIRPLDKPIKKTGHIRFVRCRIFLDSAYRSRILRGNLAPGGAVAKITGKEGLHFSGKARTFDDEGEVIKAIETGSIKQGEKTVVVLRYAGPKGGPGEPVFLISFGSPTYYRYRHARNVESDSCHHRGRIRPRRRLFD